MKTAKAERRHQEKLKQEGIIVDEKKLSPAEHRALEAEKRAAWRQARLVSLICIVYTFHYSFIFKAINNLTFSSNF